MHVDEDAPGGAHPNLALALLAAALPVFMVSLDNLVVSTALSTLRESLAKDAEAVDLQWIVNAYILGFAGALMPAAAFGDRFGRRRVYLAGVIAFTLGSVACAVTSSLAELITARALQGIAAGFVLPLALTLLSDAVPVRMRAAAVGIWSGISGLGIAMGPLVGGLVIDGLSWPWIFWVNVPVGFITLPLVLTGLKVAQAEPRPLDLAGMALLCVGVVSLVWGIVHGDGDGWASRRVLLAFLVSAAALIAFVVCEMRVRVPMLPLRFYRSRAFVGTNLVSLAMNFGVFGAIFLLAQFLQFAQGNTALEAGIKTLAWTLMPMFTAPLAGVLAQRIGGGLVMLAGLVLQAVGLGWLAWIADVDSSYRSLMGGMMLGGLGMGLVFAATSIVVVASSSSEDRGRASGANSTVREIGGALGTAVLASVFAANDGSYASPGAFVTGLTPAVWVGAAVLLVGALAALLIPLELGRRAPRDTTHDVPNPSADHAKE